MAGRCGDVTVTVPVVPLADILPISDGRCSACGGLVLIDVGRFLLGWGYGDSSCTACSACRRLHSQCAKSRRSVDVDNGDTVYVLGEQSNAHDRVGLRHGSAVIALSVEAEQRGFTVNSVLKTGTGKVAVGRINVVHHDVLNRGSDNTPALDFAVCKQEHGIVAHEVLDVIETELALYGYLSIAEIVIQVKDVDKTDDLRRGTVHLLELIDDAPHCHCESFLPSGFLGCKLAAVEVLVKAIGDIGLKLEKELVIGHLNGHIVAVILDRFDGNSLCELLNGDGRIVLGLDLCLAVGDFLALADVAILQGKSCILGLEHSAGGFLDGAHDAEDFTQMLPVAREAGYKVDFSCRYGNIGCFGKIFFSHKLSFLKQFIVFGDCFLTCRSVFDFKNLLARHSTAAVFQRSAGINASTARLVILEVFIRCRLKSHVVRHFLRDFEDIVINVIRLNAFTGQVLFTLILRVLGRQLVKRLFQLAVVIRKRLNLVRFGLLCFLPFAVLGKLLRSGHTLALALEAFVNDLVNFCLSKRSLSLNVLGAAAIFGCVSVYDFFCHW